MRARRVYQVVRTSDIRAAARAWLWLLWIDLVLRVLPFQRVLDRAAGPTEAAALSASDVRRARTYASVIELAARHHLIRARCLHRSLVLAGWLRSDGLSSALRIGVRKESDGIAAHAWVEVGGAVVNDYPEAVATFVPLGGAHDAQTGFTLGRQRNLQWR